MRIFDYDNDIAEHSSIAYDNDIAEHSSIAYDNDVTEHNSIAYDNYIAEHGSTAYDNHIAGRSFAAHDDAGQMADVHGISVGDAGRVLSIRLPRPQQFRTHAASKICPSGTIRYFFDLRSRC